MKKKSVALMMALAVVAGAVSGCGALSLGGSDTGAVPAASEAAGGETQTAVKAGGSYPSNSAPMLLIDPSRG